MSNNERRVILPKITAIVISTLLGLAASAIIVLLCSILVKAGKLSDSGEKLYLGLALAVGALIGTGVLIGGRRGSRGVCLLINVLAMEITIIVTGLIVGQGSVPLGIMLWQILCLVTGGITDCIICAALKRP